MIVRRRDDEPALLQYEVKCPECYHVFDFEDEDIKETTEIKCPHCKQIVDVSKLPVHKFHLDM